MIRQIFQITLTLGLISCNQPIFGAVISEYTFASGSAASSDTYPDANSSNFGGAVSQVFTNGWVYTSTSATASTEATALSGNSYFSFTLTPINSSVVNLSTLNFGTAFYANSSNNYTVNLFVRSSADNYASNVNSTILSIAGQSNTLSPAFTPQAFDLSAPIYQNLAAPITFRLYIYDSGLTGGTRFIGINDVTLNSATIPEPSTAGLFLIGAGWMIFRKRLKLHS